VRTVSSLYPFLSHPVLSFVVSFVEGFCSSLVLIDVNDGYIFSLFCQSTISSGKIYSEIINTFAVIGSNLASTVKRNAVPTYNTITIAVFNSTTQTTPLSIIVSTVLRH